MGMELYKQRRPITFTVVSNYMYVHPIIKTNDDKSHVYNIYSNTTVQLQVSHFE